MRTRNIAHVVPSMEIGGAEMMLANLLAGMNRKGWRSSVVSLRGGGTLQDGMKALGVEVVTVGMRGSLPGPRSGWRLRREVRGLAPQLIQGWMYHGNLAALAARVLSGRRPLVVWNIRSDVFQFSREKRLTAGLVRLCCLLSSIPDRIIYNSRSGARRHAELGFATKNATVIPNGFDTRTFAPSPAARAAFRKRLGVSEDAVLIGRIGRYHPVKDFPGFLQAAAILARRHGHVRFVLAGPGVDRSNAELLGLVNRYGLGERVHMLGCVRPANEVMAALDILCSSSAYGESFPNVLGEAMACEVPCVTTDLGDCAWIVGSAGQVVPPRNPVALATALDGMVEVGPEARKRLGMKGRERILNEFAIQGVISQYERVYEELLERVERL